MPRQREYKKAQEAHCVTAPPGLWAMAKKLGGGNRSEGVRIALTRVMGAKKAQKLRAK